MRIGRFALIHPFPPMRRRLEPIRGMGFDFADLTDNHDGATLEHAGEDAVGLTAERLREWAS